jgi:hypothetical protein
MKATTRCPSIALMCKGLLPVPAAFVRAAIHQAFIRFGVLTLSHLYSLVDDYRLSKGYEGIAVVRVLDNVRRFTTEGVLFAREPKEPVIVAAQQPRRSNVNGTVWMSPKGAMSSGLQAGSMWFAVGRVGRSYWTTIYEMNALHRMSVALQDQSNVC